MRVGTLLVAIVVTLPRGPSVHAAESRTKARLFGLAAGAALGGVFAATGKGGTTPRLDQPGGWDLALTAGSLGIVAATRLGKPCTQPECCRWCDTHLNGLDRSVADAARWNDRNRANRWSDTTAFASLGQAISYTSLGNRPAALRDVGLLAESYTITWAVTQVAKKVARRPRPYTHRDDPPPGVSLGTADARVSFFSGHTSSSFCLAVATGTMAFARNEKNAGWVLGSGLALAATTGYLRIAADRHYFTDVLVGAAVGSAAGFLVPHLHRPSEPGAPAPSVVAPVARPRPVGFTLPFAAGDSRAGALTASYADGPSLTLRLVW